MNVQYNSKMPIEREREAKTGVKMWCSLFITIVIMVFGSFLDQALSALLAHLHI